MSGKTVDLRGRKFGRLTAVSISGRDDKGGVVWHCECQCGGFKKVRSRSLAAGSTKSCGCLYRDTRAQNHNPDPRYGGYRE